MAFDYKKEYKEFYMPKNKPSIVTVPQMNFIAVRGEGDPNAEDGAYKQAIGLLYGVAYTIKMSKRAIIKSRAISIMSCRRWRAFGGRKALKVSTILTRRAFNGYPSSVCPIS